MLTVCPFAFVGSSIIFAYAEHLQVLLKTLVSERKKSRVSVFVLDL